MSSSHQRTVIIRFLTILPIRIGSIGRWCTSGCLGWYIPIRCLLLWHLRRSLHLRRRIYKSAMSRIHWRLRLLVISLLLHWLLLVWIHLLWLLVISTWTWLLVIVLTRTRLWCCDSVIIPQISYNLLSDPMVPLSP